MASNLADHTAALAAGYSSQTHDRGASAPAAERYYVTLERRLSGGDLGGAFPMRAYGYGSSEANARTAAVSALNEQRARRYGRGASNGHNGRSGSSLTSDLH